MSLRPRLSPYPSRVSAVRTLPHQPRRGGRSRPAAPRSVAVLGVVGGLLPLVARLVLDGLLLVRLLVVVVHLAPPRAEQLAVLAEGQVGVLRHELGALLDGEEHEAGLAALRGVGVLLGLGLGHR